MIRAGLKKKNCSAVIICIMCGVSHLRVEISRDYITSLGLYSLTWTGTLNAIVPCILLIREKENYS